MLEVIGSYILIVLCSCALGVFSLYHAILAVPRVQYTEEEFQTLMEGKNPVLKKSKASIYVVLHVIVSCSLFYVYGYTWELLIYCMASAALFGLSAVDFESYEIPPEYNIVIGIIGIVHLLTDLKNWPLYCIGLFSVSIFFLIIALATKGKGMGGGDIKLMTALGFLMGWKMILLVMVIGCFLGIIIYGVYALVYKKKHVLAFGPYLSAAAIISMFYGNQIIDWYVRNFLTFDF